MIFDEFFFLVYTYGIYILLLLVLFKVIMLLWYKPHRPSYAYKNFFTIYSKYSMRDEKMERWLKFKGIHNPATVLFYIVFGFWLISLFIFKNDFNRKGSGTQFF